MQRQVRRRIERNEKSKEKASAQKPLNKKWIFLAIGAMVAIVAVVTTIAAFRNFDWTVARIDGTPIRMSDMGHALWQAEQELRDEYFNMYPDDFFIDFIDYDRPFRGNLSFGDVLRQEAAINIAAAILLEAQADLLGVNLTDADRRELQRDVIDQWVDLSPLYPMGIRTRQQLTSTVERQEIRRNVQEALLIGLDDRQRFDKAVELDVLWAAQHILVGFEAFDFDEFAAMEKALTLHMRVIAGEDFEQLMLEYSDDQDPDEPPDTYTFTPGFMVPEFEQGTRDLAIGEISIPIRSDFGFHIIRRMELDPDNIGFMADIDGAISGVLIEQFYEDARARIEFLPRLDRVVVGQF